MEAAGRRPSRSGVIRSGSGSRSAYSTSPPPLLLWPRTAAYGAAVIVVIMLGGMGTHVFVEHRPARAMSELLQLVFASGVLAASDTEFFTRHGRGQFERDDKGRVARLVYSEGPHEMVAERM